MIPKINTHLTRFINWLEENSEKQFIINFIKAHEDPYLDSLYQEMNFVVYRIMKLINQLTDQTINYEQLINQAYSQIKRKVKIINSPNNDLTKIKESELRLITNHEAIVIANRLQKMIATNSEDDNRTAQQMDQDAATALLCNIVLNTYQEFNTIESSTNIRDSK